MSTPPCEMVRYEQTASGTKGGSSVGTWTTHTETIGSNKRDGGHHRCLGEQTCTVLRKHVDTVDRSGLCRVVHDSLVSILRSGVVRESLDDSA